MAPESTPRSRGDGRPGVMARALATTLQASAAPYGFALTTWGSGEMLRHFAGAPSVLEICLFVGGAITAFLTLGFQRAARQAPSLNPGRARVFAGDLNLVGVSLAVGAAALLAQIHAPVAWLLASFAATLIYLLAATAQLGLSVAESD